MNYPLLFTAAFLCVAGCTSVSPTAPGGLTADSAADGSPSPVSRAQAFAIAMPLVRDREHWRDEKIVPYHLTHNISYGARRINKGAWRVIAHSALRENRPDGGGGSSYDPGVPAAVVIIDRHGKIVSYSHSTNPYLD